MSTKVDTKLDISKILSMLSSAYSVYGYGWKLKISAKKNHNRKSHKQLKFLMIFYPKKNRVDFVIRFFYIQFR